MSLSGRDLTSFCYLHPPRPLLPSSPPSLLPGPLKRNQRHRVTHLFGWRLRPGDAPSRGCLVGNPSPPPPPHRCLLRPVEVSEWQMMVGVCAAAGVEECQGRTFPAVSFNLLYSRLLKTHQTPTESPPPPSPPPHTHTHTHTYPSFPLSQLRPQKNKQRHTTRHIQVKYTHLNHRRGELLWVGEERREFLFTVRGL